MFCSPIESLFNSELISFGEFERPLNSALNPDIVSSPFAIFLMAESVLLNCPDKFDVILLDPPYKGQRINELIEFIHEHELLSPGGIIMAECLKEDELHDSVGDIVVCKREVYGITAITIYRRES